MDLLNTSVSASTAVITRAAIEAARDTLAREAREPQLELDCVRMYGPTALPRGPSAGRRGAVVELGAGTRMPVKEAVEWLWAANVGNVLFTGAEALSQQLAINVVADRLLDRAERHSRHLELELETYAVAMPLLPSLRLHITRFVVCADPEVTDFAMAWKLLLTERAVLRLSCADADDVARMDRWMLALAAHPDGELTRSDHRIRARRRWLDVRTWVELGSMSLLPAVLDRRWNYSPNLEPS